MSTGKSWDKDSGRAILKSTSILSFGTLISRVLGFIRDMILAKLFGTQATADAFFVAFRIPNLFRDLIGEGATNSAVVPVLSEYSHKQEKQAVWNFINILFVLFLIVLSGLTILGMVLAPWLVPAIAPGFTEDAAKLELTVRLTQILFPYLVFIGLTAYSMGVLYTVHSFFWPAFSPCLLNIATIVSALLSVHMKEPVYGLAIGVLIGGVLQLYVQMREMRRQGIPFFWPKTLRHPGARKIGRLLLPRVLGSGVYQLNVFVDTFCASLSSVVGPGGISAIYYANRVVQLPQGIFVVALTSAMLPTIAGFAVRKDESNFKKTLMFSLKNIFLVMVPMSLISLVLAEPIVRVLFERGEFDPYSTHITSQALFYFSFGLFSYGGVRILVTAFNALQDTATPVKVACLCLLVNVGLNFVLMGPFKIGGIAFASSVSVSINFLVLFFLLDKKVQGLRIELVQFIKQLIVPALLMIAGMLLLNFLLNLDIELLKILLIMVFGVIIFIGSCFLCGVSEIQTLFSEINTFARKK